MLNVPSQSFPALSSQQRVSAGGRSKVPLKPGRSLMDWVRLTKSHKDLTGLQGRIIEVTEEELAKHNTKEDCWTCIRGHVYNVTPYMEYHPGGEEELMKAAGSDGTDLFDRVHRWVNYESMLKECHIGRMSARPVAISKDFHLKRTEEKTTANGVLDNRNIVEAIAKDLPPRYDWFQTDSALTVAVYTKLKHLESEMVTVDLVGSTLRAEIIIEDYSYLLHLKLSHTVLEKVTVNITRNVGKAEIVLQKKDKVSWAQLGQPLDSHVSFLRRLDRGLFYRKCKLISKIDVNYNTKLFCLLLPDGVFLQVPIGQHVYLKDTIDGIEMVKPYTPVSSSLQSNSQDLTSTDSRKVFLMIKIYPNGGFTQHIDSLPIGGEVNVSSPQGGFKKIRLQAVKELFLLAAGTGITPMVKLLNYVLTNVSSLRKVKLLFFNKKDDDILWRSQLEQLTLHDARCEVQFVLSEPTGEWAGMSGNISLALLSKAIKRSDNKLNTLVCICGPTMFTSQGLRFLEELEFSKEEMFGFSE
ncbi:cytochrome b5 reductase 4 [Ambystoma mexicanum]|uniref:cytochrome b5 reductase 4 n=1 Tax=Ambystoma mexicanum TaxID=8296 RepID=UPI0037E86784